MLFERYTEQARRTLFFARYEASQLGGEAIEAEHLLLGLIRQAKGVTGHVFAQANVSLDMVRTEIRKAFPERQRLPTSVEIPFSTDARNTLQVAADEATRLEHNYIGTEHLLLGVLANPDSRAARLLTARGIQRDAVLEEIRHRTTGSGAPAESAESAKRFMQQLFDFAMRLAEEEDVVVASLHCDWRSFGSWTIEAQKGAAADAYAAALRAERWDTRGPDVVRVSWDGRERLLTIEKASTPPLSSPGPWTRHVDKTFDHSEAALDFVTQYVGRWARGEV